MASILLRRFAAACAAGTTLLMLTTGAAIAVPAADSTVQAKVDAWLAAYPGGRQISATDIAYDGGRFVVSLAPAGGLISAEPDCTAGWFCFYDGVNFTYPRGRLSDCGLQDLARWGWRNRTESAHYNMSTGSTAFINDAATDTVLFTIGTSRRTIADVGSARNRADLVYRSC